MQFPNFTSSSWPILAFFCWALSTSTAAEQLPPPKYQVIDRMGVNAHSGQIVINIDTLSIGGERGLSHSVSSHNSNFLQQKNGQGYRGLSDKYFGNARYTEVVSPGGEYEISDPYSQYNPDNHFRDISAGIWVMRVHDHEGSADFKVMQGAYARGYFASNVTSYFYEALGDKRHTLVVPSGMPGHLLWTKPNGTKTWFYRGVSSVYARTTGFIQKVEYPNGFTLYFDRTTGNSAALNTVTTNTGFQLKYNFVFDLTASYGIAPNNTHIENPKENNPTWSEQNAFSVLGINKAFEYCSSSPSVVCVSYEDSCPALHSSANQSCEKLENEWPTAKFLWPKGIPRALFFGENVYSVIDAMGRPTEINLKPFDKYANEYGQPISSTYPVNEVFVPRVRSVRPAGSKISTVFYTYRNYPQLQVEDTLAGVAGYVFSIPGETALVLTARGVAGSATYTEGQRQDAFPYATGYEGADELYVKKLPKILGGGLMYVRSLTGIITFQSDYRNFPSLKASADGPAELYTYDTRGNLKKVTYRGNDSAEYTIEAVYPLSSDCTNPKTCNKALWVSDAKGARTYYTYHEESGQVASVTHPKNQHGISTQTRYEYEQHYAEYYNSSGIKVVAPDPVWLLVAEKHCINSASVGGACAGNDEVVTRYTYDSDNLFLTSTSTYDPYSSKVQTSCYEYDIYGNKIGSTTPNGSCE